MRIPPGAKALSEGEGFYRSAESAAPPEGTTSTKSPPPKRDDLDRRAAFVLGHKNKKATFISECGL
jgi:hypothetical protein